MQKLIFGNWKMNLSAGDSVKLAEALKSLAVDSSRVKVAVFPSFMAIPAVSGVLAGSPFAFGGQDCFWENAGAFTGEVSSVQLKEYGCSIALVGHSERRQNLNETDEMVNRKVVSVLAAGLTPVMCVGETDNDRRSGQWSNVISKQVTRGLAGINVSGAQNIIIAYEPIWAVGTGRACAPNDAHEVHALIANELIELFGAAVAKRNFRIIYGGSVDADNIALYLGTDGIDGALVGGASQKAASFAAIINVAQK
jgi:triosephosphate isomerase (TIM)